MKHLGDITKIDGAKAPAVEVIIGGSPCQDLSIAGKREGLSGERSGLFMEQIRIIKEMRRESEGSGADVIIPRFMVWENVPGAFSSNGGEDFRAVLEETARIIDESASIPRPNENWTNSGAIMGNGWSIAWRVLNAEFWGVPQSRRRIALVADFRGYAAPEILFERNSLSRDTPKVGTPWEDFASIIKKRFGKPNSGEQTVAGPGSRDSTYCIQGNCIDRSDTAGCNGKGWKEDVCYTLNTVDRPAVCAAFRYKQGAKAGSIAYHEGISPCLSSEQHDISVVSPTLCVRERCGCEGGGKGLLTQMDKSGSLRVINDQFVVCVGNGQADNTKVSFKAGALNCMHDQQIVITIDRAAFNQGINAKFDMGISENGINSTLTSRGPSAVCVATQQAGAEIRMDDKAPTLTASAGMSGNNQPVYADINHTVRRLTPLECERLQGFPDGWTDIGEWKDSAGKQRLSSDGARYKALGNSIALPPWAWILERLNRYCTVHTMASLFDGIGGFPLIWETLNGDGSCVWASEIEEFPIAVTTKHFEGRNK